MVIGCIASILYLFACLVAPMPYIIPFIYVVKHIFSNFGSRRRNYILVSPYQGYYFVS